MTISLWQVLATLVVGILAVVGPIMIALATRKKLLTDAIAQHERDEIDKQQAKTAIKTAEANAAVSLSDATMRLLDSLPRRIDELNSQMTVLRTDLAEAAEKIRNLTAESVMLKADKLAAAIRDEHQRMEIERQQGEMVVMRNRILQLEAQVLGLQACK